MSFWSDLWKKKADELEKKGRYDKKPPKFAKKRKDDGVIHTMTSPGCLNCINNGTSLCPGRSLFCMYRIEKKD